jgi:succinate dehydrogenase/fumarate reductase flavoprotein subunit
VKTKSDVLYGPAQDPGRESCGLCQYFNRDTGRCHMVKGVILAQGICARFYPRKVEDVTL